MSKNLLIMGIKEMTDLQKPFFIDKFYCKKEKEESNTRWIPVKKEKHESSLTSLCSYPSAFGICGTAFEAFCFRCFKFLPCEEDIVEISLYKKRVEGSIAIIIKKYENEECFLFSSGEDFDDFNLEYGWATLLQNAGFSAYTDRNCFYAKITKD